MVTSCCAVGCTNRKTKNSKLHFYCIPKRRTPFEQHRRELWLEAICRDNWHEQQKARAFLCSAHFISGEWFGDRRLVEDGSPILGPILGTPSESLAPAPVTWCTKIQRFFHFWSATIRNDPHLKTQWSGTLIQAENVAINSDLVVVGSFTVLGNLSKKSWVHFCTLVNVIRCCSEHGGNFLPPCSESSRTFPRTFY